MSHRYQLPHRVGWHRVVRPVLKFIFWHFILKTLFHITVEGMENVPQKPPYLVIYNHVSILDPPIVIAVWPVWLEAVAASDVFRRPAHAPLTWLYGVIPVDRGKPDRSFLDYVVGVLKQGFPLAFAPEGTRSHTPGMQRAWTGLAYIADQARVPIVPVGVVGTEDEAVTRALRLERPAVHIRVGKPFRLPPLEAWPVPRKWARRYNTDLAMYRIAALLPPEYRGVYHDPEWMAIAQTLDLDTSDVPATQAPLPIPSS